MQPISVFIVISLIVTFLFCMGLISFLDDSEENQCDMTYMFEYPQFVRVHVKEDHLYPKYGLYAYTEGRFTEKTRKMIFTGIPVLFIPGNAGSHKQARSYASIALRKSLNGGYNFHFDFFSVDLNKELNALNGALLHEQTNYIQYCLYRIVELYKNKRFPTKSIILMGHSMGGIIVRGVLKLVPEDITPLVITLATPHSNSFALDGAIKDYYTNINSNNIDESNITFISIAGGFNDFLVPPANTYSTNFNNLHVMSTAIPKCWLSVDHKCILWCKQLVLAVTRALFESIDPITKQLTSDKQSRQRIFHHHLVHNSGIRILEQERYLMPLSLSARNGVWFESHERQFSIKLSKGTQNSQWHLIPFINYTKQDEISIVAINLEVTDWIFACAGETNEKGESYCVTAQHLSHLSEISPSFRYKRRNFKMSVRDLKSNFSNSTHILLRVTPTNEPLTIHVDIYNQLHRKFTVTLPNGVMSRTILEETNEKAIEYQLILPQLTHVIQYFKLYVEPMHCTKMAHHATASLGVPWGVEDIHRYFTETKKTPMNVRLYHSKPPEVNNSQHARIRLILDPNCRYAISIKFSFFGMLGQMARSYSPLLVANVAAVILMTIRHQLIHVETDKSYSLFFIAMKSGLRPYYLLTMTSLFGRVVGWKFFTQFIISDWEEIVKKGNDFSLLPLLLYMCSVGIVWIGAMALALSFVFCESTIHKFATKFLMKSLTGVAKLSEWLIGGMHRLPEIVAASLVIVSVSSCGGLALCLGCFFYFLKLTQMSQDYIEEVVVKVLKYLAKQLKNRFFAKKPNNTNVTLEPLESTAPPMVPIEEKKSNTDSDIEVLEENHESVLDDVEDELEQIENKIEEIKESETENKDSDIEVLEENVSHTDEEANLQVEEVVENIPQETNELIPAHSSIFFHFSMFLIWFLITLLNVPYVLTWAHNYHYNMVLTPDPSFLPGIILSLCALPLWHCNFPNPNRKWYSHLGFILYVIAGTCLIYGLLSIYRLNYILTAAVVLIIFHQLFAPNKDNFTSDINEPSDDNDIRQVFDNAKTKLE